MPLKPKRRKKPNPSSTDNLDHHFSRLIRGRDLWTCQRCGKEDPEGSALKGSSLHCSHLVGRATFSTRWYPLAAVCHCPPCHMHLGDHPLEFTTWIEAYLSRWVETGEDVEFGPAVIPAHVHLRNLAGVSVKWTDRLKKDLLLDMRRELERLIAAEAGGGEFFGFTLPTADLVIEKGREQMTQAGLFKESAGD